VPDIERLRAVALTQLVVHVAGLILVLAASAWAAWPRRAGGSSRRARTAVLLAALPLPLLAYLYWSWRLVPTYAAFFEGLGLSLGVCARLSIAASRWLARLLPLLCLGTPVLVALLAGPFLLRQEVVQRAHLALAVVSGLVLAAFLIAAIGTDLQCLAVHAA
jgi:hypothetical protein